MSDGDQPLHDDDAPVTVGNDVEFEPSDVITFEFPTLYQQSVAIVGFASGTAHKAPFSHSGTECWGINQLWKILPEQAAAGKFDRWFELHSLFDFYHANPNHQQFLRDFTGPVYVREQDYALALEWGIDTAVPFPHRMILDNFRPYFNNTISWLTALAIMMRPKKLGLYGVDMAQDHILAAEYSEQRPSCEYFLGLAEASGIEVTIPNGSDLLATSHLYGYEDSGRILEKMTSRFVELGNNREQLMAQASQLKQQAASLEGQASAMNGAQQEVNFWRKNWMTLPPEDTT